MPQGEADIGKAHLHEGVGLRGSPGSRGVQEPEPFSRDGSKDAAPVPEVVRRCRVGDARSPGDLPHAQARWTPEPYLVHGSVEHHSAQVAVVIAMVPAGGHLRRITPILTATRSGP